MRLHHEISIDSARCIGCGRYVDDCPASNLAVEGKKAAPLTACGGSVSAPQYVINKVSFCGSIRANTKAAV